MNLTVTNLPGQILVIDLNEACLDGSNVEQLGQSLLSSMQDARQAVLNLGALRFIDSEGLDFLLAFQESMRRQNVVLRFCCMSKSVLALCEMMRLGRVFRIYPDLSRALGALQVESSA